MFLINSRHPLACAPRLCLRKDEALFFRSYEGNLPSSFSILLSSALVFSTSPPVSVWGTVLREGSFLEHRALPAQSNKGEQNLASVTLSLAHECLRGSHRLRVVRLTLGAG